MPTLPKAATTSKIKSVVPHIGSDTEEDVIPGKPKKTCRSMAKGKKKAKNSDSDYDHESTYASKVRCVFSRRIGSLSISKSILMVPHLPPQHFKEATPRELHNAKEFKTLYVPALRKWTGPRNLLYKVGEREEENFDWLVELIDDREIMPTIMPRYYPKNIRRMLRKQVNNSTTKRQACLHLSI
ncbi:hypothetical protein M5K25_010826 [Dendrobium thyrsiflorum]|uniref:Uncharacterized protein n=1 Tax=Dendrobium thyrsiflorum TaxID=117978 RepID=A0ABD0V857_DENTH